MVERAEGSSIELPDGALREAITLAAAVGFGAGALTRLGFGGIDGLGLALRAVAAPLGAIAAAVIAGVVVNLLLIPALARLAPHRALPAGVYGAAGALCWLIAFAGAFSQFGPSAA